MKDTDTLVLSEAETARQLGISVSGPRKWRRAGTAPRAIRIGRLVRYFTSDVREWLTAHADDTPIRQG
ncbi:MAG: helix-turn-helix domain-containing protein [Acidobacteria bacterium]|nr:helix-turn-helix domain-containing protein [Acidobacteriota bacterium]